jgi:Lon protease (S16) C-terminal proteolytic domain
MSLLGPLHSFPRRIIIGVLLACVSAASLHAQAEEEPPVLVFTQESCKLSQSFDLPVSHYSGSQGQLILESGASGRASLRVTAGTLIENLRILVTTGSDLTIQGALLRRCAIEVQPKCSVQIENSCLEDCDLLGQGDEVAGFATWKLKHSVIVRGACREPINRLGIDMQDCIVIAQKGSRVGFRPELVAGMSLVDIARNPPIRYTRFLECGLMPLQLHAMSHCTFEKCVTNGLETESAGETTASSVTLPARWVSGKPEAPGEKLSPGVRIQWVKEEFPGGCRIPHQWDGKKIALASVQENAIATQLVPLIGGSSNVAGMAPNGASGQPNDKQVKLKQTFVNGLLVMPLASGKEAGQSSKMNLTAIEGYGNVRFNQNVGSDMMSSLREVQKFMQLRHGDWPSKTDFEISFEDQYSEKDGPSAGVACSLLMESALVGKTWDRAFAVTGAMNADGAVQPIGGVGAKIRGATKGSCKIIAVPAKNEISVSDLVVQDGPLALVKICVFTIKTFEEAAAIAHTERSTNLAQAITEFEIMQNVLLRDPRTLMQILRTPQAAARLEAILLKAPNCLSAKVLLAFSRGVAPVTLSIAGSLRAVDSSAEALVKAIENAEGMNAQGSLNADELRSTLNALRNLRPKLDRRVWSYVDSLTFVGETIRGQILNPVISGPKFNDYVKNINRGCAALRSAKEIIGNDPQIIEELNF